MSIEELIAKTKESSKTRIKEEKLEMLKNAHIIDDNGYYSSDYFSDSTVANDKTITPIKFN